VIKQRFATAGAVFAGTVFASTVLAGTILAAAAPAYAREQIRIVGSSTVFPFSTAVAENFGKPPVSRPRWSRARAPAAA